MPDQERRPGKIAALDIGTARVGVAITDEMQLLVSPLDTLPRNERIFDLLRDLLKCEKVQLLIIGLPYELSGELGPQAKDVLMFQQRLERECKKEPSLSTLTFKAWDERFTSAAAEVYLQGKGLTDDKRRAALDRTAAAVMLEEYLRSVRA